MDIDIFWPRSVTHLLRQYDDGVSDQIIIAEVDDRPREGFSGTRKMTTALVPLGSVDEVLMARGGIGYEVCSWGPHPCVHGDAVYDTHFWIDGRSNRDERFQTILNAWQNHDQEVMLPDSVMLMTYGLVPRYLTDGTVCWDDPRAPVYDVVRARSHINYKNKSVRPLAQVTMRRDYLEDYCSLKGAAAVAVYYEERFDLGDKSHADALNGKEGAQFELPGRLLGIANLADNYSIGAPQMTRVWGSQLMLKPAKRPISEAKEPELIWPDHDGPMTQLRAARDWLYAYVSDAVLVDYESRSEFSVHPESGGVSYGGWWATNRTSRVGRQHIRIELKSLYEGCPPHVIAHWHRFAVPEAIAEADRKQNDGDRNIAVRAKEMFNAFLRVTESLESVADRLGLDFAQEEICGMNSAEVKRIGWSSVDAAKPLFETIALNAPQEVFLGRAISLFKLIEFMKPAPLRNMALTIGVQKSTIADFGSLKLLGTLCQLFTVANERGYKIPDDAHEVVKSWDGKRLLPSLTRVFALKVIRDLSAHLPGSDRDAKLVAACVTFGIDHATTVTGWGVAVDILYDRLIEDLHSIAESLKE